MIQFDWSNVHLKQQTIQELYEHSVPHYDLGHTNRNFEYYLSWNSACIGTQDMWCVLFIQVTLKWLKVEMSRIIHLSTIMCSEHQCARTHIILQIILHWLYNNPLYNVADVSCMCDMCGIKMLLELMRASPLTFSTCLPLVLLKSVSSVVMFSCIFTQLGRNTITSTSWLAKCRPQLTPWAPWTCGPHRSTTWGRWCTFRGVNLHQTRY